MAATIMDGKALASKVKEEIRERTSKMEHKPGLAVVLVGDDPASRVYVNGKKRDCGECGIYSEEYALPAETSQQELLELEEMGTAAAILGKSLYTGALDLRRCVALVQK